MASIADNWSRWEPPGRVKGARGVTSPLILGRESCLPEVEKPRVLNSSEPAIRAAADPLGRRWSASLSRFISNTMPDSGKPLSKEWFLTFPSLGDPSLSLLSSLSPSLELGWETAPMLYVVDAADVVRVGGKPLSKPEITS